MIAGLLRLAPASRAELLLEAPKILQGFCAGIGDYYTWLLAQRIFGPRSNQAWAVLALTVLSPWQWFCSTRTLSNCLETTLTIAAMYNWPWHWSLTDQDRAKFDTAGLRIRQDTGSKAEDESTRLRRALLPAALATILRPTNLIIWITLAAMTCLKMSKRSWIGSIPGTVQPVLLELHSPSFLRATSKERIKLFKESLRCGSAVLVLSVLVDRFYYQSWMFPPIRFLYFNLFQSLSVFYGNNDWHYYLSQGLPLLLTTALPFAVIGIYRALFSSSNTAESSFENVVLSQFATIACVLIFGLSLISHKEVRFIYPLLPLLHILAAIPLNQFFAHSLLSPLRPFRVTYSDLSRRLLLGFLLLVNATIGIYTSTTHNRGVIDVLTYLRHQHEAYVLPNPQSILTAAFLMPCHSTPWRSHLVHNSISAWALTCEPPVHLTDEAKASYIDEADLYYANPMDWLTENMSRQGPRVGQGRNLIAHRNSPGNRKRQSLQAHHPKHLDGARREWPDYLVFFEQAEKTMEFALRGSGYGECWRGFNTHWHDDWRRRGDVIVWCLFPGRIDRHEHHQNHHHQAHRAVGWAASATVSTGRMITQWLRDRLAAATAARSASSGGGGGKEGDSSTPSTSSPWDRFVSPWTGKTNTKPRKKTQPRTQSHKRQRDVWS